MIPLISIASPTGQIVAPFSQDGRGIVLSRHEDVELFVHHLILLHVLLPWSSISGAPLMVTLLPSIRGEASSNFQLKIQLPWSSPPP